MSRAAAAGEHSEAVERFRAATALLPQNAQALRALGSALAQVPGLKQIRRSVGSQDSFCLVDKTVFVH